MPAAAAAAAAVAAAVVVAPPFAAWCAAHGVAFGDASERDYRAAVYAANVARIGAHNARRGASWRAATNVFSHLTADEWAALTSVRGLVVDEGQRRALQARGELTSPNNDRSGSHGQNRSAAASILAAASPAAAVVDGEPAAAAPAAAERAAALPATSWLQWIARALDASAPSVSPTPAGAALSITESPSVSPSASASASASASPSASSPASATASAAPAPVDWVAAGYVSPVVTQGSCGACYAFAAVAAVESWAAIRRGAGPPTPLSQQQVLDCSLGNSGCSGGTIPAALAYVASTGLCAAAAYPYVGAQAAACGAASCTIVAPRPVSFAAVDCCAQAALEAAVAQQPVVVAICAREQPFQFYAGGVLSGACCTAVDHAVAIVGFGTDPETGLDFWLLKNQWGVGWGEGGFMRLARGPEYGSSGNCGVLKYPARPT